MQTEVRLVGRDAELERLAFLLAEARDGRSRHARHPGRSRYREGGASRGPPTACASQGWCKGTARPSSQHGRTASGRGARRSDAALDGRRNGRTRGDDGGCRSRADRRRRIRRAAGQSGSGEGREHSPRRPSSRHRRPGSPPPQWRKRKTRRRRRTSEVAQASRRCTAHRAMHLGSVRVLEVWSRTSHLSNSAVPDGGRKDPGAREGRPSGCTRQSGHPRLTIRRPSHGTYRRLGEWRVFQPPHVSRACRIRPVRRPTPPSGRASRRRRRPDEHLGRLQLPRRGRKRCRRHVVRRFLHRRRRPPAAVPEPGRSAALRRLRPGVPPLVRADRQGGPTSSPTRTSSESAAGISSRRRTT